MSELGASYHHCLFVPGQRTAENGGDAGLPTDDMWNVCVRPTDVCRAAMQRVEAKLAAVKRLRGLAELCGHEVLDLSLLAADDILHLYASRPGLGYGQIVGRQLSVQVRELQQIHDDRDPLVPATVVRANVVRDSYNDLPPTERQRQLAVPEGSDISIVGSYNNQGADGQESYTRFGLLVVGSLAVYEITKRDQETGEDRRHAHGMMLQEVGITDPAGVETVLWDTDPLAFNPGADFLKAGWEGGIGPAAGTLDS